MKRNIKIILAFFALTVIVIISCKKTDYNMGDLKTPSNIVIDAVIIGQDATHPDGDGSGDVKFILSADDGVSFKIDYDSTNDLSYVVAPGGIITKKYTTLGLHSYTVTVIAYGRGGASAVAFKEISVRSDFIPDPAIVTRLTNDNSKTWVIDKDLPAHFGVGPWDVGSVRPEWYAAAPNEKAACCPCFYSASFTFTKPPTGDYTIKSTTPDGAFTKTGVLAGGLPGIPGSGGEACYPYSGGITSFSFVPASSGVPETPSVPTNFKSTQTSILLSGASTFIGYGAVLKEYEILEITDTTMHLRVQGTETGNAWYMRLKSQ